MIVSRIDVKNNQLKQSNMLSSFLDTTMESENTTENPPSHSAEAYSIANHETPIDFFFNHKSTIKLPNGWTTQRKRASIFEFDTNIQTLSELYSALMDLRNQLPDPVASELEAPFKPTLFTFGSSSSSCFTENSFFSSTTRSVYHDLHSPTITSLHNSNVDNNNDDDDQEVIYQRLEWTYPDFIFDLLIDIYFNCCISPIRLQSRLDRFQKLSIKQRAYLCAIYAYSSLHALICHPERFSMYSLLMQSLAKDAYKVAFELVEFDSIDVITVETLVIMYQYLMTSGYEGEARNLFSLAQRQMELLLSSSSSFNKEDIDLHRLFVWMTDLDWSFALLSTNQFHTHQSPTTIRYCDVKASLKRIQTRDHHAKEDELSIKAAKFRIKGLHILLATSYATIKENTTLASSSNLSHSHERLNRWRSKYLKTFLYKRQPSSNEYTLEDQLALRLHALYFTNMLGLHQQHMLKGFEEDQTRWGSILDRQQEWTDYFNDQATNKGNEKVERGLYSSMNAAYGFIQVIQLLLNEKDYCTLPQVSKK
ncbi:uncharacterized protein BX663DRAFT_497592 [Cokeromyces recurvatus]|uniref:uncharacterized protein n=1 Tax=Cokeromyces recurvatus TaxID=90255 RepID=UPI00221FCEF5|nr:uncharacterized protein BX663DRAFT_497592 [Cokeromyces recurvatus]KAI7906791.1 hypothetical protein BX663DRAFT_497592 [Cokeromyces recurvatus]